ncbi:S8 family serine peptidase [Hymenobacter sp. RP-2-7]|uniref:S8 family serine peptidase n=1 Tax=Hymenobacter polaris TaxID=2682546 RepID=A0A7Y0AE27_9BACT|nr:S8 family peptidase [Hymenobacter polaris]NML65492.1 S8 family serine peptidase [Hymenobacter polaris]
MPPTEPGRLLLKLKPGATPGASLPLLAGALRALGATSLTQKFPRSLPPSPEQPGSVDLRLVYEVQVPPTVPLTQARAQLLATGGVEYVEPAYVRQPQYQPNDPLADSAGTTPQYHLKLTQAYRAWDFTRGDTSMVIGLTDTGMRVSHEDLVRQLKYNYADPINGLDDDHDGYVDNFRGWDTSHGNNDPAPEDPTVTHGSTVVGIAAGQANNGLGGAGVGFNCKYLPVQVFPSDGTGTFAGYEAIVYAADHGCRVINMSWGGEGGYSRYEQDVCAYAAINRDAVLVAAAGNSGRTALFYPASYDYVLAVASTDAADAKASSATYNYRIDLAAPGMNIRSVFGRGSASAAGPVDQDYWVGSGSSFASPQVAAAAALVRVRFPQLTAEQVRAQLRRAADPALYQLPANAAYAGQLGAGRLNVARAVAAISQREARVVASTFAPSQPTGYNAGDTLQLSATVRNLLLPISGLQVTLTSLSPYLVVRRGSYPVGSLATLGQASNAAQPFRLAVAAAVPTNTVATLRYRLTAPDGYQTDQYLDVLLSPDFAQLDAGDLVVSLTGRGNIGYENPNGTGGLGLGYKQDAQLLAEGGLLLATSPTRVADRLRAAPGTTRQSFYELGALRRLLPGPRADQQFTTTFRDSLPDPQRPRSVGVRVRERGQSWASPAARRGVILLDYVLRNLTADTLKPLYAGLFMDWDLPGSANRNVARYDSVRRLGYCYDPTDTRVYTGVRVLSAQPASAYAIDNNAASGSPLYLGDGFSPAEKYLALSGGTTRATWSAGPGDIAQVLSARVARLAPGDSVAVAFALVAASTLPALQAAADEAQRTYQQVLAAAPPAAPAGWQLYPNPTAGPLRVGLPLGAGAVMMEVLNELGQLVRRQALPAGGGELSLAGLPAGLYWLRATGGAGTPLRGRVAKY